MGGTGLLIASASGTGAGRAAWIARAARVLNQLVDWHGLPKRITVDNGPEFAGQALDAWAYRHGVQLDFIDPGKPMQNGFLESFNGKFRDECLNQHWFVSLAQARQIIAAWKEEYNTQRPHSALAEQTPAQYASVNWPTAVSHYLWTQTG